MIVEKVYKAWEVRKRFLVEAVRQDRVLVSPVPLWQRVLFLLTNIPYFLVALYLFSTSKGFAVEKDSFFLQRYMCTTTTTTAVTVLAIALASTLMHTAQMRLDTFCCSFKNKNSIGTCIIRFIIFVNV